MKGTVIAFFVVVAISVLIGIASGNYWGGIITFLVLGLITANGQYAIQGTWSKAYCQKTS